MTAAEPQHTNLFKGSFGILVNQVILLGTSLVTFYVLARRFGVEQLGIYSAALAFAAILGPLFEVGASHLSVYRYSTDGDTDAAWRQSFGTHLAGGLAIGAVGLLVQPLLARTVERPVFALLLLIEIAIAGSVAGAITLLETTQRVAVASRIRVWTAGFRLIGVLVFFAVDSWQLREWVVVYLVSNLLGLLLSLWVLHRHLGVGSRPLLVPRSDVGRGLHMAGNQVASQGQSDADKLVLALYDKQNDLGIYSAGYRVATLASLPVYSLLASSYGRFFSVGAESPGEVRGLAIALTKRALLLAAPVSIGLVLFAPLVPVVLGDEYDGSVNVIRVLALLPILKACQEFAGNALTGAGRQRLRMRLVVAGLMFNVVANLALVPRWGWQAAAASTFVTETAVAIAFWRALSSSPSRS